MEHKTTTLSGLGFHVDIDHFDRESIETIVEKLKQLKARWIRLDIDYSKYHGSKERMDLLKLLSSKCTKANIVVVGLFSQFVPATLRSLFFPVHKMSPVMSFLDSYLAFVKHLVSELHGEVSHWEIWNEQNSKRFWGKIPDPKEYVFFLREIKKIVKKQNPSAQIIFGGINGNDITPMFPMPRSFFHFRHFLKECLSLGVHNDVDYIAFHPYTTLCYASFHKPATILKSITNMIQEAHDHYGKHRLIVSEIGVSNTLSFLLKPADIVLIYKEVIDYCQKLKIPVCLYTLSDPHPNHYSRFNPDRNFGFLDHYLKEKKLFTEFKKIFSR